MEVAPSPVRPKAPADEIPVNGCGASIPGQIKKAATATGSGWLAHTEAGPRVRGKEAVQKSQYSTAQQHKTKDVGTAHPVAHTAVKSSLGRP